MIDLDELITKLHNLANLKEFVDDALAELLSDAADALESVRAERDDLDMKHSLAAGHLELAHEALQRVRDRHQPCLSCLEPHCFVCEKAKWPCAEFRALEGNE